MIALLVGLASCKNPTSVEYEPYESPGEEHPNDEYYDLQWHYRQINMPGAWAILRDSELDGAFGEAVVAVLDTAYDTGHDDLENAFLFHKDDAAEGYDFSYDDEDPSIVDDNDSPDFHGSHVAGTIAADTNNNDTGVAGIGWDRLRVLPVQVFDDAGGSSLDVIVQAIYYAAGDPNESEAIPSRPVNVINMSFGFSGDDAAVYDAINAATKNGITVIAASGNSPDFAEVTAPAAFDNTIAVGATNKSEHRASYSLTGPEVDFSAPGGETEGVLSTVPGDYDYSAGTSMATPHVSGVVGLLYSYAPNLTQDAVYAVLQNTAK
ncbi:MAG: S8 family serine peptidase, partial [Spirochaetia bacterium]